MQPEFERRGWRIIRSQVNQYLGGARNTGFRATKGEYVVFMDDDNYAKPHEVGPAGICFYFAQIPHAKLPKFSL
jgi:glycosyltransferase involved in cell wall biosynthesis